MGNVGLRTTIRYAIRIAQCIKARVAHRMDGVERAICTVALDVFRDARRAQQLRQSSCQLLHQPLLDPMGDVARILAARRATPKVPTEDAVARMASAARPMDSMLLLFSQLSMLI